MVQSSRFDFDLLVIGAGSGGVRTSRIAAGLGAKVAVCEDGPLGGTCVNVGCVPKKLMVVGSHFSDEWRAAKAFGWSVAEPSHDWTALIAAKDKEILRLNGVYQRLLESTGVTIVRGRAKLVGPHHVEVTELTGRGAEGALRTLTAERIVIAVGGEPVRPTIPGAELLAVSDDVFHWPALPRHVLIVGGGYIAVEFAGVFSGYGAKVTEVHRGPMFLRGFDDDVAEHLAQEMTKKGIALRFGRELARIDTRDGGGLAATLDDGSIIEADAVLAAIGRRARTKGLGLEAVGVRTDAHGSIQVDARFRTSVPSVFAIGDVIGRIALTPVALAEGTLLAYALFGGRQVDADYDFVPSAVFSNPQIGTVGLTSDEACDELGSVDVYRSTFTPMKATLTGSGEKALMKVVCERATGRVVGLHVVGPDAAEIVQGFAVALKCGVTKAQLDATIGIHPTAAEELVTMRERVQALERAPGREQRRKIVHHRWEDEATRG